MTERATTTRGSWPSPKAPPGVACYYERRAYRHLFKQLQAFEEQLFWEQGQLAIYKQDMEFQANVVVEHQMEKMQSEVIEALLRIYDNLSTTAQELVDRLVDLVNGRPPIYEDISVYNAITDVLVDLTSLIGGLINMSIRLAAYTNAVMEFARYKARYELQLDKVRQLEEQWEALNERVREARQNLIECERLWGVCAACWQRFYEEDLRRCEGCGAQFCDLHFSEAIEQYELEHGNPNAPS